MGGKAVNGWRFCTVEGDEPEAPAEKPAKKSRKQKQAKTLYKTPSQEGMAKGKVRYFCSACNGRLRARRRGRAGGLPEGPPQRRPRAERPFRRRSRGDGVSWDPRFQAAVPERLTTRDALALLDLLREDPGRLLGALEAFVASAVDTVVCKCFAYINPACGGHAEGHIAPSAWRAARPNGQFFYLCEACRQVAPADLSFEHIDDEEEAGEA